MGALNLLWSWHVFIFFICHCRDRSSPPPPKKKKKKKEKEKEGDLFLRVGNSPEYWLNPNSWLSKSSYRPTHGIWLKDILGLNIQLYCLFCPKDPFFINGLHIKLAMRSRAHKETQMYIIKLKYRTS